MNKQDQTTTENDAKTPRRGLFYYIPPVPFVLFCLFFVVAICHAISFFSVGFADFFNENIGAFVRMLFAKATGWIPISLTETIIVTLPISVGVIFVTYIRHGLQEKRTAVRFMVSLLSVLSVLYTMFALTAGVGYRNSPLDEKLGIEKELVSADDLYNTALKVSAEIDLLSDGLETGIDGSTVMPYGLDEMNDKINDAYSTVSHRYPFIQDMRTNVKYVALSKAWTYTHFSGVYCYYTGEANININFPDYTLPYTTAHELAHQRGIAAEDEANFVAFLVCISSEDDYIKYSGYQNMLEYLLNALHSADKVKYGELTSHLNRRSVSEINAYNEFFEPYRQNVASTVSSALNDTYLKAMGESDGEKSYGMVVDLAVAYYRVSE